MKRVLAVVVLGLIIGSLQAADKPKPNTLTPQEIADGWLLLFDGETTFGWKIDGESSVADGMLKLGGDRKCAARFTTPLDNFELQFDCRTKDAQAVGKFRIARGDIQMQYGIPASRKDWCHATHKVTSDPVKGNLELVSESTYPDGSKVGSKNTQAVKPGPTFIEFDLSLPASLRNIKLRPLGLKPLFNGKDLAGWKEQPGKKSRFSVENGAIRIQNGPGDLQSEGQWDDFILQLECKVNGNRLNSGVFFRCRPGEYQQGYEAQIHNGFSEKPKEYIIDEFDPKTGNRLDKKRVKYTAIDYGTGAIYRRIPARKQVAKDNEWFTMTVAAAGRQLATWVNGVQVVDWTDYRSLANNARNGCRLEKGPISFQGHDPTTDLNFRNIRIGEIMK